MPCSIPQRLDEVTTPSRKRRRESEEPKLHSSHEGVTNDGFSSTPRKDLKCSATFNKSVYNERSTNGHNPFISGSSTLCMEVKSIAGLANEKIASENPYEIVRKPPKKKKRPQFEDVCFENAALALDGPERPFNPFEVQRDQIISATPNCFTNSALNIKSPENAAVNPFEVTRKVDKTYETTVEGIENPALEEPTPVTLTLPFTPTIGCRIDFNGIALDNLTPSKLLAEKLVFSPPPGFKGSTVKKSFRRSLSVISEETVDIGKELDCYQLELENSINEAKLNKKPYTTAIHTAEKFSGEDHENNQTSVSINITNINISVKDTSTGSVATPPATTALETTPEDNDSEASFEDDIDFKEPAPFVRCYRKSELPRTRSEEIACESNVSKGSNKSNEECGNKHKFSNAIRKSIRKIMGVNHREKKPQQMNQIEENQSSETNNLLSTLRHSMRRKNNKCAQVSKSTGDIEKRDVSIIDTTEQRKVFKFNSNSESSNGESGINEKPLSFRRSLRKSTRDIRNQVMKKVFHKSLAEYKMKD